MTTPDAKLPKALWLDKTRFEHRMKTDPDADKLRAALPEQIKVSLDRSERFEPVTPYLVYAIAERLDMEKEAGRKWPFYAGWHEAHQCVKAAKEFVNTYKYTQTVDAHCEQLATHGDLHAAHVAQFAEHETFISEQKDTNDVIRKEVDACVDGHTTTQRDVKEQRRAMDKVKHTVEGAIGEQSRMAETLENELMGQRKERKELQGKTVEKAEAAAGLQQEVKMLAQLNDDNCKRLAASDEANRVLTAQNAELKAQLVLAKDSGEQAAKHAEKDQVRERKFQEREKDLLAQTRRESHGRHEKEKEQIVSRHAEERKALDDRLVAEGRKVAAVEAERDALTSKVKESDARVRAADERAATLDAKREELAAKLKDALAAEARASTELEKAKIALRQAHDQQSKVSGAADEVRGRCVKLEADLVAARAELKALARRPRAAFSPDPLKSQS